MTSLSVRMKTHPVSVRNFFERFWLTKHCACHRHSHLMWVSTQHGHHLLETCNAALIMLLYHSLYEWLVHSQRFDETFDLGLTRIDHELVGIQLHWQGLSQQPLKRNLNRPKFERADLSRLSLKEDMQAYKVPNWNQDIEKHVDHFNEFRHHGHGQNTSESW